MHRATRPFFTCRVAAAICAALTLTTASCRAATTAQCVPPFGVPGWQADGTAGGPQWQQAAASEVAADVAQLPDAGTHRYDASLLSPPFIVPVDGALLEFRQRRDYSWANTVGVLEISVDDAAFVDIAAAGGVFQSGSYDGRSLPGNPLGFRSAWAAASGIDTLTRIQFPPTAQGHRARLRFRAASGGTGDALPGWSLAALRCMPAQ